MISAHRKGVTERGDHVMGFSHDKTTHRFRMFADGGEIEVQANDPKDWSSRDLIRNHLFCHIAAMFAAGDFNAPMLIHDRVHPGAPIMQRLKDEITYRFSELGHGTVRITTHNAEALKAVHEFLTFQIADLQTGDSLQVPDSKR